MHCYCQSLNLDVGDKIENIPLLKDTLDMAYEIIKLIMKMSSRRGRIPQKTSRFSGTIRT